MRTSVLISALVLLLVANFLMMYVAPFGLINMEGYTDLSGSKQPPPTAPPAPTAAPPAVAAATPAVGSGSALQVASQPAPTNPAQKDGFSNYTLASGGAAGDAYQPMGAFDNIRLSTGNSSTWRYTAPNEPLQGPEFKPGPDDLFMFKNNQCKPECCGASFSCDGGCVCTTAQQRDFLNKRGGNRTAPDDGV